MENSPKMADWENDNKGCIIEMNLRKLNLALIDL